MKSSKKINQMYKIYLGLSTNSYFYVIENGTEKKKLTINDSEKILVGWIKNGNFSYCSFDKELTCITKRMRGSLSRNGVGFDDAEMTENVCQIYISYDNKLSNDSFSYAVVYNDLETAKPANGDYHIVKKIVNTDSNAGNRI